MAFLVVNRTRSLHPLVRVKERKVVLAKTWRLEVVLHLLVQGLQMTDWIHLGLAPSMVALQQETQRRCLPPLQQSLHQSRG